MSWIKQGNVRRVMIPAAIFPQLVAGVPAARVYGALALRADNATGVVDSSAEQIAQEAEMGLSQAKAGIKRLLDDGWMTKLRQGNSSKSNRYQLHTAPVDRSENRPVDRSENRPVDPQMEQPDFRPEPVGKPAETGRKTDLPLVSPLVSPLGKDTLSDFAESESDDARIIQLFDVRPSAPSKAKSKARTKEADPGADRFDEWYAAYPKHEAKGKARAAWSKAIKKVDVDLLIRRARDYAAYREGEPARWTKHPATWLNAECWDDEYPSIQEQQKASAAGGHQPFRNPADQSAYDEDLA